MQRERRWKVFVDSGWENQCKYTKLGEGDRVTFILNMRLNDKLIEIGGTWRGRFWSKKTFTFGDPLPMDLVRNIKIILVQNSFKIEQ